MRGSPIIKEAPRVPTADSARAVALAFTPGNRAEAGHPHLHHAVYELRLAHEELEKAGHNFNGHKQKSMQAIEAAYRQIEKCLEAAGDPYRSDFAAPAGIYKKYRNHFHLRHSLVDCEARTDMKAAVGNFGGHKQPALDAINVAIAQVEKCIEHAR